METEYEDIGYTDAINVKDIEEGLRNAGLSVRVYYKEETGSTNEDARRLSETSDTPVLVIANMQKKGRGRRGRDFFSPAGSGLYMSLAIPDASGLIKTVKVTAAAAVAVARAVDETVFCGHERALIKWVNDIYIDEKKVCGILTEAFLSPDDKEAAYMVIGIGINVYEPGDGFPQDIQKKAGYLISAGESVKKGLRNRLAAEVIKQLFRYLYKPEECLAVYRKKSNLIGCRITINSFVPDDKRPAQAKVIGIDDECGLMVEYEDGQKETLTSGEVSVIKTII